MKGYNLRSYELNAVLRTLFFLQFFHIGYMFHTYWETILQHFNKFYTCILCVFINEILIGIYNADILFYSTASMASL